MRMINADELLMLIDNHDNMVLKAVNSSCLKDVYKMAHVHIKDLIETMPTIERKTGMWLGSGADGDGTQCDKAQAEGSGEEKARFQKMNKESRPSTDDDIDHGTYLLADCFEAVVEHYEDGYVNCPIIWSGGTCQECLDIWKRRKRIGRKRGRRGDLLHQSESG